MNQGFATRQAVGSAFSERIFNDLVGWGFGVALNGTEHTHPDFVAGLKESEDWTSLLIRYQPDGVISNGRPARSAFVEAKASKTIEKNAYLVYRQIQRGGALVYIVFDYNSRICFTKIQDLEFDGNGYNPSNWTRDSDGWLAPRMTPDLLAEKRRNGFRGSGTPYRYINPLYMKNWDQFPAEFAP